MSINPLLYFAKEIHDARSAASAQYRQLFHKQKYEDFVHALLTNIVHNAILKKFPNVIYNNTVPPKTNSRLLLTAITSRSPRLRTLFAAIANQVVIRREKALIFCQHPFKQMLVASCLNLVSIRTRALLSNMDASAKDKIVRQFNTRNQPADVKMPAKF
ncbi:hypothetical protein K504DRAFT_453102 [Pleomassaria siparia CBS 279.74]|uniref:Uncharacterized protein n=1 Tax=Pleomassaria siparia CBS 279.74 TaxID=1314801 RepID=A0A6G1JQV0_9PLEO|nr:hypothetical protein K504DRAFT_453102 [Pleomassaria siparia CBS 279.74]